MDKKKVVVTGLGCITPLGNDVKTYWEGIRAGRCGIKTIERFDTSRLNVKVAGEVRVRETEKLEGFWVKKSELSALAEQLEGWSKIAMEAIV